MCSYAYSQKGIYYLAIILEDARVTRNAVVRSIPCLCNDSQSAVCSSLEAPVARLS